MKPNWYAIVSDCVERGASFGVRRAHKHVDNPKDEEIIDHVVREVMTTLSEAAMMTAVIVMGRMNDE